MSGHALPFCVVRNRISERDILSCRAIRQTSRRLPAVISNQKYQTGWRAKNKTSKTNIRVFVINKLHHLNVGRTRVRYRESNQTGTTSTRLISVVTSQCSTPSK